MKGVKSVNQRQHSGFLKHAHERLVSALDRLKFRPREAPAPLHFKPRTGWLLTAAVLAAFLTFGSVNTGDRTINFNLRPSIAYAQTGYAVEDFQFKKGVTTIDQAVTALEKAGIQNVKVFTNSDGFSYVAGDGLRFLLAFVERGYFGVIDFSNQLAPWAEPKNYAVLSLGNGSVFITAENFFLIFPDGAAKQAVFTAGFFGTATYPFDRLAQKNGGFTEPVFYFVSEKNLAILHAKDANGEEWSKAYGFDAPTGKLKGELDWEKVKPFVAAQVKTQESKVAKR